MILPPLVEDGAWYGPASATFLVQFPGDPYDPKRNDVRVVFLGEKSGREERPAFFDPVQGAWRARLFTKTPGRFRPTLVRNGKAMQTEPQEGIVEALPAPGVGILKPKGEGETRFRFDTGKVWAGVGADLGASATPARIDTLADSGATWVHLSIPHGKLPDDALVAFGDLLDAVERRGLDVTLSIPLEASAAWRRYALARLGDSPRLVQWNSPVDDPWKRAAVSTSTPWPSLFENRPGPFIVREGDAARIRALRTVLEKSDWTEWRAPQAWKAEGAKGVADGDRMILVTALGAKLKTLPLADGSYDVTTIDPSSGATTTETMRVSAAALALPTPGERFFVLKRKDVAASPTPQ